MNTLKKNSFSLIIFAILILGVIVLYQSPNVKPETISLNTLVQNINQDQVDSIEVQDNTLTIVKKDGTKLTATKEPEASLTETLSNYQVNADKLSAVSISVKQDSGLKFWASALLPIILPFILIGAFLWFMFRQASRGNSQALSFGLSKARILDPNEKRKRVTFKDVAGSEEAKQELQEIVEFLKEPKRFLDMGAKIPKGVLLLGAPGTGKTLMAKAVAGEAGVPFFNISGSEFVEMFVGVGASRVRDLFRQAKKQAPAIVFIDEIDAVGRHRGAGLGGGHDEREQTLNQILVEMDGFETDTNVIVLASTNRPDVLDPALLRPGRFDRRVTMDLPDLRERQKILELHIKNKPLEEGVNLRSIAERTPGFSGADLANLLNEGAILAARKKQKKISELDLKEAIEKVLLGPERKSRLISQEERKIVAYHEGGHALVGASLKYAHPVHKVSIISRGHAGGYTLAVPEEDKTLHSRNYFQDELAMLLGGYASEKLVFQDLTTGPSNDIERATQMARNMVTRYGMSTLGARTFGKKEELVFLGKEMHEEKDYSENTAEAIDKEVSQLINDAFKRATEILTKRRAVLDLLAQTLLKQETIEKQQFDEILAAA